MRKAQRALSDNDHVGGQELRFWLHLAALGRLGSCLAVFWQFYGNPLILPRGGGVGFGDTFLTNFLTKPMVFYEFGLFVGAIWASMPF